MTFENLNPIEKKELIKSCFITSIPILILFFLPLIYVFSFIFGILECFIKGHELMLSDVILCIIGTVVTFCPIYALFNHSQFWLFHQLISNQCRVSVEYVEKINIDKNTNSRIKKRNQNDVGSYYPDIQFVTTSRYDNIPTIYSWVDENIKVNKKVFIVTLKNGMNFALKYPNVSY